MSEQVHILAGGVTDPHFLGFHKQRYDVHGKPDTYYNLYRTDKLSINAHFAEAKNGFTKMDEIGFKLGKHRIKITTEIKYDRPLVTFDDQEVDWLKSFDLPLYHDHKPVKGHITVVPTSVIVHIGLYIVEVVRCVEHPGPAHPKFGKFEEPHLDIYLHASGFNGLLETLPEGILGVSCDPQRQPEEGAEQGEGMLTGGIEGYERDSLYG